MAKQEKKRGRGRPKGSTKNKVSTKAKQTKIVEDSSTEEQQDSDNSEQ